MQEQTNTVRQLRSSDEMQAGADLSEDLTEAVEKAEAAYWAVRGLQHSGCEPQPEAWEGVLSIIAEAGDAARRVRYACYPGDWPSDARAAAD